MRSVRCAPGAILLTLLVLAAAPAAAQQATLTLSRDVALWSDVIEARITGTGCSAVGDVQVNPGGRQGLVEIELTGCADGSTLPFSAVAFFGPLFPGEYSIRLVDARGSRPALDTAMLTVHGQASLDVELPEVATDAAPVTLVLSVPASSPCFLLDGPAVEGHAVTFHFADECPVLPVPAPGVFHQEVQVGPLPAGEYEVRFFDLTDPHFSLPSLDRSALVVHDAGGCVPSPTALCLLDGRFRVEARWKDFTGGQGVGHALPLSDGDGSTGLLWFFAPDNVEVTVKVLNACALGGHFWVFLSSGSSVEYTVTVTDTRTGMQREYSNESGQLAPLRADTSAFACDGTP